jgi:hypothetical protein
MHLPGEKSDDMQLLVVVVRRLPQLLQKGESRPAQNESTKLRADNHGIFLLSLSTIEQTQLGYQSFDRCKSLKFKVSGKLKGHLVEGVMSQLSKDRSDQQVHDACSRFGLFKALRSLATQLLLSKTGHGAEAKMGQDQLGRHVWGSLL